MTSPLALIALRSYVPYRCSSLTCRSSWASPIAHALPIETFSHSRDIKTLQFLMISLAICIIVELPEQFSDFSRPPYTLSGANDEVPWMELFNYLWEEIFWLLEDTCQDMDKSSTFSLLRLRCREPRPHNWFRRVIGTLRWTSSPAAAAPLRAFQHAPLPRRILLQRVKRQ